MHRDQESTIFWWKKWSNERLIKTHKIVNNGDVVCECKVHRTADKEFSKWKNTGQNMQRHTLDWSVHLMLNNGRAWMWRLLPSQKSSTMNVTTLDDLFVGFVHLSFLPDSCTHLYSMENCK